MMREVSENEGCAIQEQADTTANRPPTIEDVPYGERLEAWLDEHNLLDCIQELRDTENDEESFYIQFYKETSVEVRQQSIAALRAAKFSVDEEVPFARAIKVSVPNAWIPPVSTQAEIIADLRRQLAERESELARLRAVNEALLAAQEYRKKALIIVLEQFESWNSGILEAEIALQNAADIAGRVFAKEAKEAALLASLDADK